MDETLESWGAKVAADQGQDPSSPTIQAEISTMANKIRQEMPGATDAEIIQKAGPVVLESLKQAKSGSMTTQLPTPTPAPAPAPAPTASPVAGPSADVQLYQDAMRKMQRDFSPEKEQAVRDQVKQRNLGLEVGRNLSLGARIGAGSQNQAILDKEYERMQGQNNAPLEDWTTKKKAAIAGIEQQLKLGEVKAADVRAQLNQLGLEQALLERSSKQKIADAEADPLSATSEGMRHLAKQYSPDFAAQLGPKFDSLTAAQLKATLPALEKQYLKQLEIDQKNAALKDKTEERAWKTGENQKNRDATIKAAGIKASGSGASAPKTGDVLRGLALDAKLQGEGSKAEAKYQGAEETVRLFDEYEKLIKGGLATGPVVGGDNIVSKAYGYMSDSKQKANQLGAQLASSMAKTFGAAPSDKETALIREANDVKALDNPLPAIAALRAKFERQVQEGKQQAQAIQAQRNELRGVVGKPALPNTKSVPNTNAKGWKLHTDASGNRAYVSPDGKSFEEVQ